MVDTMTALLIWMLLGACTPDMVERGELVVSEAVDARCCVEVRGRMARCEMVINSSREATLAIPRARSLPERLPKKDLRRATDLHYCFDTVAPSCTTSIFVGFYFVGLVGGENYVAYNRTILPDDESILVQWIALDHHQEVDVDLSQLPSRLSRAVIVGRSEMVVPLEYCRIERPIPVVVPGRPTFETP